MSLTTCDHCGDQAVIRKTRHGALCDMHHKRLLRTGTVHRSGHDYLPPPPGRWVEHAACKGTDLDDWFPVRGGSLTALRAICAACPVIDRCRTYALAHPSLIGVWGGTSERQRRLIRQAQRTEVGS
jgi:WhiB family redox-sensing transcriptional regulator